MTWDERNSISVVEICYYFPCLFIGLFLSLRHGFHSSGWMYMIIFSLARIVGSGMQLGIMSQPTNTSLYIGSSILATVGLSPLMLVQLGLLRRVLVSIQKSVQTVVHARMLVVIQIAIAAGLGLSVYGGVKAGNDFADTGVFATNSESKIGSVLMIVCFILVVLVALQVGVQLGHAEDGEKRIGLAVGLSMPFVLVRLAYAAETSFGNNPDFNLLTGNANVQLGMSVIPEMFAVAIIEAVGLTLQKVAPAPTYKQTAGQDRFEMGSRQELARPGYYNTGYDSGYSG